MLVRGKSCLFFTCLLLMFRLEAQPDLTFQKHCVDSLTKRIDAQAEDTVKVGLIFRKAYHEYWLDTAKANELLIQAGQLASKLHYLHGEFMQIYTLGNFAEYGKNYPRAVSFYEQSAGFAARNHLISDLHDAYSSLLNLYFYIGEYVYALDICHKGLHLADSLHDAVRIANYTNLQGFIYRNMHQDKESEAAYRKYLAQAQVIGDSLMLGSAYMEMTQVMISAQRYDSAEIFAYRAYDYYDGIYNRHRRAYLFYLIAEIDLHKGLREAAINNALNAIKISYVAPCNEYDVARYYIIAGKGFLQNRLTSEALLYLDTGLQISERIHHRENIRDAYQLIAYSYNMMGENDSAYRYLSMYDVLQDSLLNEDNLRTIAEMNAKYELDQKERNLQEIKSEEDAAASRRWLAIGLSALTLLTIFLIYNRYRLQQKNQLQLTINQQQNELFQKVVSAQEKERKRIAEQLHDGIGSVLSAASLQLQLSESEQDERYTTAQSLIKQASEDLRKISHSIMPTALARLGLPIALQNVIAALQPVAGIKFTLNVHGFDGRPPEETELALYNISMELINNIVKHSKAKNASLQLTAYPDHINLIAEDDGQGFDVRSVEKKGVGISNIRSRVAFYKGGFAIDSSTGKGCTVSIDLPIA